jgi:hypothetical protein
LEEDEVEVATVAAEEVFVVAATGVVEALVERVVGVTTGATEVDFGASTTAEVEVVEGLGAALLEAVWISLAGVFWMKTAWLEREEEAEEVVAGAALVEVAEGVADADSVCRTGVPSMVPVPIACATPVT